MSHLEGQRLQGQTLQGRLPRVIQRAIARELKRLYRRWRLFRRRKSFGGVVVSGGLEDAHSLYRKNMLVLMSNNNTPKWLRFDCPCRCGAIVALNLMAKHSPRWSITHESDGTLTVSPSIDAKSCGSHYWIRRSRVEWV